MMRALMSLTLATTLLLAALATGAGDADANGSGGHGHGHGHAHDQGHDHGHDHGQSHGSADAIGSPGDPAKVDRTIDVVMHDSYFEPARLRILEGETVRFRVVNAGDLVHEFNIGTAAMHTAHAAEMQALVEQGVLTADRIDRADAAAAHDHANSLLLEPGGRGEIVWQFPTATKLEFACNVPGHYEAGMAGEIRVE